MEISYHPFELKYKAELCAMVQSLYLDDHQGPQMTDEKIELTISFLGQHPHNGRIVILLSGDEVVGYSIVTYYWSNEYGGLVLFIDELYIKEAFRGKSIGSHFIQHLLATESAICKVAQIEVFPSNTGALRLYTKMGFEQVENKFVRQMLNH
jgi:ribosomal protein S18 acetylase RimI-like enzyme